MRHLTLERGPTVLFQCCITFYATTVLGRPDTDNCAGQNKNCYVMAYLMWRVLTGLHQEIKISFLLVGHTKFSPDWCFGLFKRLYRRTEIASLDNIAQVAERSA